MLSHVTYLTRAGVPYIPGPYSLLQPLGQAKQSDEEHILSKFASTGGSEKASDTMASEYLSELRGFRHRLVEKIGITLEGVPVGDISAVKLTRTDTTSDLSL